MRHVSDGFLLNMAEVSASLIGLFLVGVFFYIETGFRRLDRSREVVALEPIWSRVLFALLSLVLIAANIDTAARIRSVGRLTRSTAPKVD